MMPTGYTHNIPEGITLRQFMLQCVRAMGVLITMRDDPSDAPIPKDFEPDDYHLRGIQKAEAELARLKAMSPGEIEIACAKDNTKRIQEWESDQARCDLIRASYENMLSGVTTWAPPTSEHENFKKFMTEQITDSIKHDCNTSYYQKRAVGETPEEWRMDRLESAEDDINRHQKMWAEEKSRTAERNAWLKAFWNSLPPEESG